MDELFLLAVDAFLLPLDLRPLSLNRLQRQLPAVNQLVALRVFSPSISLVEFLKSGTD